LPVNLPLMDTKWDKRFSMGDAYIIKEPSPLLVENISVFPTGRALDIASGNGRNAVFLAQRGFKVDAVDNSRVGLLMAKDLITEKNVRVNLIFADLEYYIIKPERYDLIVDFYYLNRNLFPDITTGLKSGGYLVFESLTTDDAGFSESKNPKYYLNPNELFDMVSSYNIYRIVFYRETETSLGNIMRSTAQVIAQKKG
jgi:tellurite methyltransferase